MESKDPKVEMERVGDWSFNTNDKDFENSVIIVDIDGHLYFRITMAKFSRELKKEFVMLSVVENEALLSNAYVQRGAKHIYDTQLAELKNKLKPYWQETVLSSQIKAEIIEDVMALLNPRLDLSLSVCFFRGNQYIWLDCFPPQQVPRDTVPTSIRDGWPGVTFDSIDTVLNAGPESIYFFSGDQYIRFNWTKNRADEGYPKNIREHWAGVTFDRIDAALFWRNSKAYFFRGDRYIVYDMTTYRADPGYPKYLPGSYIEDWKLFD